MNEKFNQEFVSFVMDDIKANNGEYLEHKFNEFMDIKAQESLRIPREMYRLRLVTKKKVVTCEYCTAQGEVKSNCTRCGGKGVHFKSYECYEVAPRTIKIVKIDRDPKTGILRYWENMSEYYYETVLGDMNKYIPDYPYGVHFLHFTKAAAENEAERLNKIRAERGLM